MMRSEDSTHPTNLSLSHRTEVEVHLGRLAELVDGDYSSLV